MFDEAKHKTVLVKILKAIYSDPDLRNVLGFKGGTAAYLFHNLPRISVDLDFDLLNSEKENTVFEKISIMLVNFGKILDKTKKRFTLFFLVSYGHGERNIKIEISKRAGRATFVTKNYLGISILLMKKEDMVAGKLAASLTRKKFAARDLFDLWYFLKEDWNINEQVVENKTGLSLKQALIKEEEKVKQIKTTQLLQGLGDLIDEKQKRWVKKSLLSELLFLLKLYQQRS